MKNLKKVLILLVLVAGSIGLWSHVLAEATAKNSKDNVKEYKTPLLRWTYIDKRGYINQEYQDGSFKLIKPETNEYICWVGDNEDETHDFTNREDMDNFFNDYFKTHKNLNLYGL